MEFKKKEKKNKQITIKTNIKKQKIQTENKKY